jgi:osmoprotectant transport system substrate-binding protein
VKEITSMKKLLLIIAIGLIFLPKADACVGRILNIGVTNSAEGQVFAEMLSAIINERTGTTVYTKFYKNQQELYEAVKNKKVDILIENTTRALQVLNKPVDANAKRAYDTVRNIYEKEKGLAWLKPYGFVNSNGGESQSYTATVMRVDVFSDFPALPRVVDKLGGMISDEAYMKMIKSVEAGEKPKKVARDFLKSKKLI